LIFDGKGNVANYVTTSISSLDMQNNFNVTVGASIGASFNGGFTTADDISKTEGKSFNIGLEGDVLGGFGGEVINPNNIDKNDLGNRYVGASGGGGLGFGADWYMELTNTTLYNKRNIPSMFYGFFNELDRRIRQMSVPPNIRYP
jgi:hypothetical protein